MSKRRSRLREPAQVAQEVGPVHGGTCTKSFERDSVTTASEVARDAQGSAHTLADDIRISSLEGLLPDDLEKHAQWNLARLTSYVDSRRNQKHICECGGRHAHARNTKPRGPSYPGGDDPVDIGALGKGKGKHDKGQGKLKQGHQGVPGQQDKNKDRTRTRNQLNVNGLTMVRTLYVGFDGRPGAMWEAVEFRAAKPRSFKILPAGERFLA